MHRLAWHREKKSVESGEIYPEDSSVEPYFVYAIIMSVVAVRKISIDTMFAQIFQICVYTHVYAAGPRTLGDFGDEEKNRTSHASFPGGG